MDTLAQPLLVHPVVVDSQLDVLHVYLLCEALQFLKFVFAEDAQEGRRCHVQHLAVGHCGDSQLARDLPCLLLFALHFEQADFNELFETKEATSVDLSNEVMNICLLCCLLPDVLAYRDYCLLGDRDFGLDL